MHYATNGLVKYFIMLFIEMIDERIKPNMVTFIPIIYTCQQTPTLEYEIHHYVQTIEYAIERLSTTLILLEYVVKPLLTTKENIFRDCQEFRKPKSDLCWNIIK